MSGSGSQSTPFAASRYCSCMPVSNAVTRGISPRTWKALPESPLVRSRGRQGRRGSPARPRDRTSGDSGSAFHVRGEIPRVTAFETGMQEQYRLAANGVDWEPDPLIVDERYV